MTANVKMVLAGVGGLIAGMVIANQRAKKAKEGTGAADASVVKTPPTIPSGV